MRLNIALSEGLELPDGPVLVRHPDITTDLSALSDPVIETPDIRVADHFSAKGLRVNPEPSGFAAVMICVPRSKHLSRDLIATSSELSDLIIVDGQKTDGIDSLWKAARKVSDVRGSVTKAHGRLFWMTGGAFGDWHYIAPDVHGFALAPGVFSGDGIDPGSYALAEAMPAEIKGRVADLGAGWGYLSAVAQTRGAAHVDMVEANAMALGCAEANTDPAHATAHWADATTWRPATAVDHVIMNPPFHQGRKGAPDLGQAFITNAARCLAPRGSLWMVANRHLPYEDTLGARFGRVETLEGPPGSQGFKLFHATRPKR